MKATTFSCVAIVLLCVITSTRCLSAPSVTLKHGACAGVELIGTRLEHSVAFLGIDYGSAQRWHYASAPPVCTTRSGTAPQNGTLRADRYGFICPQMDALPQTPPLEESEQCLNLDVYVPRARFDSDDDDETLLPVVVWLHGGSNVIGSSTNYAGLTNLVQLSGSRVVVASVNFRLGALGFFAHTALTAEAGTSGNYGIYDSVAALRFVRDNIAQFGGDRDRVTLLGQSSGGTNIFALLASDSAHGLFHAAISLSGSPNVSMSLRDAERQNAQALAASPDPAIAACATAVEPLQCLRALPTAAVQSSSFWPDALFDVVPLLPQSPAGQSYKGLTIVDGVIVNEAFDELMRRDGGLRVPLLLQTMLAEMDTFGMAQDGEIYPLDAAGYRKYLAQWFAEHQFASANHVADVVASAYAGMLNVSTELAFQTFVADYSFYCASLDIGASLGNGSAPLYVSIVAQSPASPLHVIAGQSPAHYAGHMWDWIAATEAWDFFEVAAIGGPVPGYTPSASDIALGAMLRAQWFDIIENPHRRSALLTPVQAMPGAVNVQGLQGNDAKPIVVPNYRASQCRDINSVGLANRSFWIVN
jgi:carboxylesterase type B